MNVRDEIKKTERAIQSAVNKALHELHVTTGLYPASISVPVIDAATHNDPYQTVIGRVKITVR
jgi:hypothetical protein